MSNIETDTGRAIITSIGGSAFAATCGSNMPSSFAALACRGSLSSCTTAFAASVRPS